MCRGNRPAKLDRRRFLKRGLAGGALLIAAGTLPFAFRTTAVVRRPRRPLRLLAIEEYAVLDAVAARIVPGDKPDKPWPSAYDLDCAGKIDALMATVHPDVGGDFRRLLRLLESGFLGTFIAGSPRPFTRAAPPRAGRAPGSLAAVAHRAAAQRLPGGEAPGARDVLLVARDLRVHRLSGAARGAAAADRREARRERAPRGRPGRFVTGAELPASSSIEVDYIVVGSGAGGGAAAAVLAEAGARVAVLEEGGHYTRADFNMQEAWVYPALYQEHGNRATDDLAIMILQGRNVGGGTTVNWTSSFRTPEATLRLWADRHGVRDLDAAVLAPHFAAAEARLDVADGNPDDVNANNRTLLDGGRKLGWNPQLIRRSVNGCARLGYCGMGCPIDAKRSSRTTYLADAVAAGADVYSDCRGASWSRPIAVRRAPPSPRCWTAPPIARAAAWSCTRARASCWRAARSTRRRCCCVRRPATTAASWASARSCTRPCRWWRSTTSPIEAFYGPPQSVAVHHFADRGARVGYFFETAPVHPMLGALAFPGFGDSHRRIAERLPFVQATIALLIDGHHDDAGGDVQVNEDGRIRLRYPLHDSLREAAVDALGNMARLQLAAGRARGDDAARDADRDPQRSRHRAHRGGAVRRQPAHDVLGAPDGRLPDGQRPAPLGGRRARPPSPRSRTCSSPTARSSRPRWGSTRSCRSTPTPACSRPRSRAKRSDVTNSDQRACRRRAVRPSYSCPVTLAIRDDVPLAPLTTLELGGPARHFVDARDDDTVVEALRWADARGLPRADPGRRLEPGRRRRGLRRAGDRAHARPRGRARRRGGAARVTAAAGEPWDALVAETRRARAGRARVPVGHPGPGRRDADPERRRLRPGGRRDDPPRARARPRARGMCYDLPPGDCGFAYRDSAFKRDPERFVVLGGDASRCARAARRRSATAELADALLGRGGPPPTLADARATVLALRRRKSMVIVDGDPEPAQRRVVLHQPDRQRAEAEAVAARARRAGRRRRARRHAALAGARRRREAVGGLADRARRHRQGHCGAARSACRRAHALALVHHGGGSTAALLELAREMRDAVRARFGITLTPEPTLIDMAWFGTQS